MSQHRRVTSLKPAGASVLSKLQTVHVSEFQISESLVCEVPGLCFPGLRLVRTLLAGMSVGVCTVYMTVVVLL